MPTEHSADTPDVEALQEQILLLRSTVKALTESLGIANSEAEMFKRQSAEFSLKLDALGIAGLEKDKSKIEQRLLSAVRDLRLLKKQNEDEVNQLVRLTEAVQVLIKNSNQVDADSRMAVEAELRKTNEILGNPQNTTNVPTPTLSDGVVVDVRGDLSLVVINLGEKHGARIGMPFQVWRGDKRIGQVRVIDVRERISGAIIQNLESETEPIGAGDRLKVDAKQ